MIELRSDTFTLPTPAMLEAAQTSPLGDDVWGEDPTVRRLEHKAAELMGKEAGLFVSSGTQGNLVSILSHTVRGDEVIVGDKSHIVNAEVAASAVVGGVQLRTVPNTRRGMLDLEVLQSSIRQDDIHYPPTRLICLENSHNACGGAVLTLEDMASVRDIADAAGAAVHLDGARIFNAAVALRVSASSIAEYADSVTFCLSKGLSAPIGSVVCGSGPYVDRARKYRKMLGGGMRQAGIIAGPGLVALDTMIDRLARDHENARFLGQELNAMPGVHVDLLTLQTNIVIATFDGHGRTAGEIVTGLERRGVRCAAVGPQTIRFVTHRGVDRPDIEAAVEAVRSELGVGAVAAAT